MKVGFLFGPVLVLGVTLAAGQGSAPQVPTAPSIPLERRMPIDEPGQVQQQPGPPKVDAAQLQREASELAKLAGEIPTAVDQAGKGVISKDLNDRLKRIEKLSKQLRRELFQ
ncbi:MAG TPA: hypothetical protein VMO17_22980 [Terriglobia bacterium]|nr:hypothetical protein [Terriglobia bacterium]